MKRILISLSIAALAMAGCARQPKAPTAANVPAPEYAQFSEGLIDDITPEGWLKEILVRQQEGLTGHPEAMAYPYDSCLWAGELSRDSESRGSDWWSHVLLLYLKALHYLLHL